MPEDWASCDILVILSFLQELLDKGHSPSMLKVYVAAIAGQSVGRNSLVVSFSEGIQEAQYTLAPHSHCVGSAHSPESLQGFPLWATTVWKLKNPVVKIALLLVSTFTPRLEHRLSLFLRCLLRRITWSLTFSALWGHWEFTSSVPPRSGSQNNSLYALVATPKGLRSQSRTFQWFNG